MQSNLIQYKMKSIHFRYIYNLFRFKHQTEVEGLVYVDKKYIFIICVFCSWLDKKKLGIRGLFKK